MASEYVAYNRHRMDVGASICNKTLNKNYFANVSAYFEASMFGIEEALFQLGEDQLRDMTGVMKTFKSKIETLSRYKNDANKPLFFDDVLAFFKFFVAFLKNQAAICEYIRRNPKAGDAGCKKILEVCAKAYKRLKYLQNRLCKL